MSSLCTPMEILQESDPNLKWRKSSTFNIRYKFRMIPAHGQQQNLTLQTINVHMLQCGELFEHHCGNPIKQIFSNHLFQSCIQGEREEQYHSLLQGQVFTFILVATTCNREWNKSFQPETAQGPQRRTTIIAAHINSKGPLKTCQCDCRKKPPENT